MATKRDLSTDWIAGPASRIVCDSSFILDCFDPARPHSKFCLNFLRYMRHSNSVEASVSEWVYNEVAHVMMKKTNSSINALWKLIEGNCTCLEAPSARQDPIRLDALRLVEMTSKLGIGITDAYIIETAKAHGVTDFISFDIAWEFIQGITVWTLPDHRFAEPDKRAAKRENLSRRLRVA